MFKHNFSHRDRGIVDHNHGGLVFLRKIIQLDIFSYILWEAILNAFSFTNWPPTRPKNHLPAKLNISTNHHLSTQFHIQSLAKIKPIFQITSPKREQEKENESTYLRVRKIIGFCCLLERESLGFGMDTLIQNDAI